LAAGLGGTGGATLAAVAGGALAAGGLATGAVLEATTTFLAGAEAGAAALPADDDVCLRADLGAGVALAVVAPAVFRFLLAGGLGPVFSATGLTPALAAVAGADFGALADDLLLSPTEATDDLAEAGAGAAAGVLDGVEFVFPAAGLANLAAGLELPLAAAGPVLATR